MAYVTPQTYIYLYNNIDLPSNYEHTFYFNNLAAQTAYFTTTKSPVKTYAPTTYQNITAGVLRVGEKIKDIYDINYMKFTNGATNYENKTYYCFVTNVVYINENTTEIHYTVDVMQTYLFQYSRNGNLKKKMFVDRTHIPKEADKINGQYTRINETNFDLGQDMVTDVYRTNLPDATIQGDTIQAMIISVGAIEKTETVDTSTIKNNLTPYERTIIAHDPSDPTNPDKDYKFQDIVVKNSDNYLFRYQDGASTSRSIYGKDQFLLFPFETLFFNLYNDNGELIVGDVASNNLTGVLGYIRTLQIFNALGKTDSIVFTKLIPSWITSKLNQSADADNPYTSNLIVDSQGAALKSSVPIGTSVDGYTPKNKKVLTYPYNYIVIDNNDNEYKEYKPQFILDKVVDNEVVEPTHLDFNYQSIVLNTTAIIYPINYMSENNKVNNYNFGLSKNVGADIPFVTSQFMNAYANSLISRNLAIVNHANATGRGLFTGILSGKLPQSGDVQSLGNGYYATQQGDMTNITRGYTGTLNTKIVKGTGVGFAQRAAGVTLGAMNNSANFVDSLVQQTREQGRLSSTVVGNFDSYMNFGLNRNGFTAYKVHVNYSVARRIDNYFSVYGYKVSEWRTPQLKVRKNWTFIKTAGCAVTGDIPKDFESAIDQIFDNGITFWANTANFMDYGDFTNPDP